MTLVRFEPFRGLASFHDEINRLFDGVGSTRPELADKAVWVPALDVQDTEAATVVTLDVPGVDRDDIAIELDGRNLTISGERVREESDEGDGYSRTERRFGSFTRTLVLPEGVDESKISADYADGVLSVAIPKPQETKPHRIEISGS